MTSARNIGTFKVFLKEEKLFKTQPLKKIEKTLMNFGRMRVFKFLFGDQWPPIGF